MKMLFGIMSLLLFTPQFCFAGQSMCTYETFVWNVEGKQSVDHKFIKKPYSALLSEEVDQLTGCTVCEEDRQEIELPNIKPFKVCKRAANKVKKAIQRSLQEGQIITEVTGYRVGRTKGVIDTGGNRTRFSNHSFGTAIDINASHNGLYDHCEHFSPVCRLIKGGKWSPDHPQSLKETSPIVLQLELVGFHWGGTIAGKQKDFMHFSASGY